MIDLPTSSFSIYKGEDNWETDGPKTTVNIHLILPGYASRELVEEKLEELIGQVLDVY